MFFLNSVLFSLSACQDRVMPSFKFAFLLMGLPLCSTTRLFNLELTEGIGPFRYVTTDAVTEVTKGSAYV